MPKTRTPEIDVGRLTTAMRRARKSLEYYRQERFDAVKQYVGRHWSEEGSDLPVPVNLLALYVKIVGRSLVAKNPRVMLSTFDRQAKAAVSVMQAWANAQVGKMDLARTLRRVVLDALFSVGVCKVALSTPADSAQVGWRLGAGQPFAERVDLDDFVFDVHARDFGECSFLGHRIRVPLDVANALYRKGRREKLTASPDARHNADGDERIGILGRGSHAGDTEEFEEMVDLWEVYLPRHRVVVCLSDDQVGLGGSGDESPLHTQPWLGPDSGPYHVLAYGWVPGNAMPKAPVQDLIDLHMTVNRTFRKLARQAERQKEVLPVRAAAAADGSRLLNVPDGEAFACDNADTLRPLSYGGPSQVNFQFFEACRGLFSWLAGNLDIMGGLSPQSKTATQDKMLDENSSASVGDMQDTTVNFVAGLTSSLCWYWHHHPTAVMRGSWSPPGGADVSVARHLGPDGRRGVPFEAMDVRVDPYSMAHWTPQQRAGALNQMVQQTIAPMLPLLQQQGIVFDLNSFLSKQAAYLDMPDLAEIVTITEPPPPRQGGDGGGDAPGMPAATSRTYTRENRSERTQQGNSLLLQNALLGVNSGGARGSGRPAGA